MGQPTAQPQPKQVRYLKLSDLMLMNIDHAPIDILRHNIGNEVVDLKTAVSSTQRSNQALQPVGFTTEHYFVYARQKDSFQSIAERPG